MGIDRQTDAPGELQIGPTTLGMVRIYVAGDGIDLPMDFTPEEAREIAAEIIDAAERAESGGKPQPKPRSKPAPAPAGRPRTQGQDRKRHANGPRRKPKPGGPRGGRPG